MSKEFTYGAFKYTGETAELAKLIVGYGYTLTGISARKKDQVRPKLYLSRFGSEGSKYRPDIYDVDGVFKIETRSEGALDADDINELIACYSNAVQLVRDLEAFNYFLVFENDIIDKLVITGDPKDTG